MRVGIDYRPALVQRTGSGRYVRELVRALCEHNFAGNLGLFGHTGAARLYSAAELGLAGTSAELARLRVPERLVRAFLARTRRGADDLLGGVSVFHHTQLDVLPVRAACEVATILDSSFLYDADYAPPEESLRRRAAARALVERAARILVPSEFTGAELVMALGAHPARVSTVELGCDHVARALEPGPRARPAEPYVLSVGRVDKKKNHVRMLGAFERLVREGLPQRWIVVGPPGYGASEFRAALARSPAESRVSWRAHVGELELARLYAEADLFLHASLHEGSGLAPLEAMAAGAPVVASAVTALPEILGDAAFLVEPSDEERIFEAARRVLSEPELALALAARGEVRARKFKWKSTAKHTLIAYQAAQADPAQAEPRLRRSL